MHTNSTPTTIHETDGCNIQCNIQDTLLSLRNKVTRLEKTVQRHQKELQQVKKIQELQEMQELQAVQIKKLVERKSSKTKTVYTKNATLKMLNGTSSVNVNANVNANKQCISPVRPVRPDISFSQFEETISTTILDSDVLESSHMSATDMFLKILEEVCVVLGYNGRGGARKADKADKADRYPPILALPQHKNVFFVYGLCVEDSAPVWEIMEDERLHKLVQRLHLAVMAQNNAWRERHLPPSTRDVFDPHNHASTNAGTSTNALRKLGGRGRAELMLKYQMMMSKVNNVNIFAPTIRTKIKTDAYRLLSGLDVAERYHETHFTNR